MREPMRQVLDETNLSVPFGNSERLDQCGLDSVDDGELLLGGPGSADVDRRGRHVCSCHATWVMSIPFEGALISADPDREVSVKPSGRQ